MGKGGTDRPAQLQAALRDGQLIRGVRDGDRDSQVAFYQLFREQVSSVLFRLIGNDATLPDLVQAVFVSCYQNAGLYKSDVGLTVWLYQVCVDVATEALRARGKNGAVEPAPEKWGMRESGDLERGRQLLSMLPLSRRVVFFLHEVEGLPVKDIAYVVRSGAFVVRGRLFAARREFYRLASQVTSS